MGQLADRARRAAVALFAEVFGTALEESFGDPRLLDGRGYSCFDLFGVDLMFGEDLRPYILEVNMSPNMWVDASSSNDPSHEAELRSVKEPLITQLAMWAAARILRDRDRAAGGAERGGRGTESD